MILDLNQIQEREDRLQEKLAMRLFNETLGRTIQIVGAACQEQAKSIIDNAEGDLKAELDAMRDELSSS
jgi:hypothetical protein